MFHPRARIPGKFTYNLQNVIINQLDLLDDHDYSFCLDYSIWTMNESPDNIN